MKDKENSPTLPHPKENFIPLTYQSDNYSHEQGEFDGDDDIKRLAVALLGSFEDFTAFDKTQEQTDIPIIKHPMDRKNILTTLDILLKRILEAKDDSEHEHHDDDLGHVLSDGMTAKNMEAFLNDKEKFKNSMLIQQSDIWKGKDSGEWESLFSALIYPNQEEISALKIFASRNKVAEQCVQNLNENSVVVLHGVVHSHAPSKQASGLGFFEKNNYQSLKHSALVLGVSFIHEKSTDARNRLNGLAYLSTTPEQMFEAYKESEGYKEFEAYYTPKLEAEIDKENTQLKNNFLYLMWEVEWDITNAMMYETLKDMYNIPIDQDLIDRLRALESSFQE